MFPFHFEDISTFFVHIVVGIISVCILQVPRTCITTFADVDTLVILDWVMVVSSLFIALLFCSVLYILDIDVPTCGNACRII